MGVVATVLACLFRAPTTQAQAPAEPAPTPPSVLRLGDVEVPEGIDAPPFESVEVAVRVGVDGHAEVESIDVEEPWATRVREAVAASEFTPATVAGRPVPARVRLRIRISVPEPARASDPELRPPSQPTETPDAGVLPVEPLEVFRATARVGQARATVVHLAAEQIRDVPGTFGDPLRIIEALPGVVPIVSGLPYVYVRGAPPAGSLYYWDGLVLPQLFHFALGPAVVHPALVGDLDFYAGVSPSRYGRHTGATIAAEGPGERPMHREIELRLIDINGVYEAPVGESGRISVAARYGYPGLLLSLLSPNATLSYWDYQGRLVLPLDTHNRIELVSLGSYDAFGDTENTDNNVSLQFHRIESRFIHRRGFFEFGSAFALGFDRSSLGDTIRSNATSVSPRLWLGWGSRRLRFRVGADQRAVFGTFSGGFFSGPEDRSSAILTNPIYASIPGSAAYGVYVESMWTPTDAITVDLGLRADAWLAGSNTPETAVEPRAMLSVKPSDSVTLHTAFGLAHQPAVFLLPLPGLTDLQLAHGLQSAVQSEVGARVDLPGNLRAETTLFAHRYDGLLIPDLFVEGRLGCVPFDVACYRDTSLPRASAWSYGAEFFLKRDQGTVSGWLSYTLGWATAESSHGASFTPSFDVRHVLNFVFAWKITERLRFGLRAQLRSGRLATRITTPAGLPVLVRYDRRLPWFFRLDAELSYTWPTSWGEMRVALEWFNTTLAVEPLDINCNMANFTVNPACTPSYGPSIFLPSLGLRANFR